MKKTPLLSMATIMSLFTPEKRKSEVKAVQILPIPKETGNVLIDTKNFIFAHMPSKGFRYPAMSKTKKGAQHYQTKSIKNAVQLRRSRLAISA